MKIEKEIIRTALPYVILAILVLVVLKSLKNSASKTMDEVLSGDILKSKAEKSTDKKVVEQMENQAKNWFQKELALPVSQKTQMTRASARNIANALHSELRNAIQTMTGANQIYELFRKIGTLGGLYFVMGEFGVRDGMDLPAYMYKKVGFSNTFSKDLDEINQLFASRKINFRF